MSDGLRPASGDDLNIKFDSMALSKDIWSLFCSHFGVMERRLLILSCKAFYNLLTSDIWFADPANIRYLLIYNNNGKPISSIDQDDTSRQIMFRERFPFVYKSFNGDIYKKRRIKFGLVYTEPCPLSGVGDNFEYSHRAIYLVDSWTSMKKSYVLLSPSTELDLAFDCAKDELINSVVKVNRTYITHKIAYAIHTRIFKNGDKKYRSCIELVRDIEWTLKDYADMIVKILRRFYYKDVSYVIKSNYIVYKPLPGASSGT